MIVIIYKVEAFHGYAEWLMIGGELITTILTTRLGLEPRVVFARALDTSHRPLAQAHHPHLGRMQLWLRHSPRHAGHTSKNDAGTTTTYIPADLHEVATALTGGEPHPLAHKPTRPVHSLDITEEQP